MCGVCNWVCSGVGCKHVSLSLSFSFPSHLNTMAHSSPALFEKKKDKTTERLHQDESKHLGHIWEQCGNLGEIASRKFLTQ